MASSHDQPIQISLAVPRSLNTRIYLHLTAKEKSVQLFLTTASPDDLAQPPPMGSFVYSIPDRFRPTEPLSTPLYVEEQSIEFTTRLAKLLARKTKLPIYVGNSMNLSNAGLRTVEEEVEAFRAILSAVTNHLNGVTENSATGPVPTNGITASS